MKAKLAMITTAAAVMLAAVVSVGAKTTVQGKISSIEKMVDAGKLPEAAQKLKSEYRFDKPDGLMALRRFSVLVLRRGLSETDLYERVYAASALGATGDSAHLKLLEAAFVSPDPGLRMAAADGLGDMDNAAAAQMLARLYHSSDAYGRRLAVQGLSQIDDPGAKTVLAVAIDEKDNSTRLMAADALGRMKDTEALPQLRRLLITEKEMFNRVTVAHSMLLLGDNSGLDTLFATLHDQSNIDLRAASALALGEARDPRAQGELKRALVDPELEVKIAAASALTHYNDGEGLEVLRIAMRSEDSHTRSQVGQVLERVDFGIGRAVLLTAVSSFDPVLRLAGTRALGLLGGEPEVAILTDSLNGTNDPIMRADVAWALGRLARPGCIKPLIAMVLESDPAVRYTAADALARTTDRLLNHSPSAAR